jgi:hypothetical protein
MCNGNGGDASDWTEDGGGVYAITDHSHERDGRVADVCRCVRPGQGSNEK